MDDWTLERYAPGDEQEVLALYTNVFEKPALPEHWNWQFRDNPYGGPFIVLGRSTSDRTLIGSYSVMPVQFNLMGRPVAGCQSVDTMVRAGWRNRRVFEKTAQECYAWCAESGIQAIIGFPSERSYPGLVRTLDWRRVAFPRQYVLRLDLTRDLELIGMGPFAGVGSAVWRGVTSPDRVMRRRLLEKQVGPGVEFSLTTSVPDDYDSLWSIVRSQEVLSVWKDADYFRWRYDRHPTRRFRYVAARRAGELVAVAVVVDLAGTWSLCEFLVRGRDVPLGRLLADRVTREAGAAGAARIEFIGHDVGFFDEAFAGFERRLSTANVVCARAFTGGLIAELLPHGDNWTVTFGDGDFV